MSDLGRSDWRKWGQGRAATGGAHVAIGACLYILLAPWLGGDVAAWVIALGYAAKEVAWDIRREPILPVVLDSVHDWTMTMLGVMLIAWASWQQLAAAGAVLLIMIFIMWRGRHE